MDLILKIIALVFAVVIHEVAHGYAAYLLGDPTAKRARRLTLNPLAHLDLFGSIILPLLLVFARSPVLLGWAKPVPFNPAYFRDPRRGIMIVGAAGPLTNFLAALASAALLRLIGPAMPLLAYFLVFFCATNLILGLFNLIPIPPLDGSRIALGLLSHEQANRYLRLEPFGFIIIFALLWLGVLDHVIFPIFHFLLGWLLGSG
ncbi:MAG: site-2 protease family protein [Kiritimatiellae bacterium]|jgi:Zn-dependent protease|nr:site-2 protease family protein [Kiritimatiellia bacterium]